MSKKVKILRIITRLNIGGPAIHAILLAEGLDTDKFETVLITGLPGENEGDMLCLAQEKDVKPVIIPELGRSLSIYRDLTAFWKLFCLVKKEKPDIIHTHTAKAGTLGRLAGVLYKLRCNLKAESCKLKLIHTFHGHVLHGYFSKTGNITYIWIERILALFTDRIIVVSKNLREELVKLKIATLGKIITVPLGLELDKFLRIEDNKSGSRNYKSVGIIGRLVPIKNHKMFLDAAKRISETLDIDSGQDIKFLIVGDGFLRQELENYAEELDIKQGVTFTGWIRELEKVYCELDIVVLTSLNEGTPVVLIEAQAAARPCVATMVGGVADVVEHGKSGLLVSSGDVEGFSKALIKLLNNPELIRTMGEYGRNKVRDRFSSSRLIKDIEKLYVSEVTV